MRIPAPRILFRLVACIVLLLPASTIVAQSAADQSFKTIPQQVKDNAETKATTKTNTVSGNAMNKLDSASNKAFKGVTNLFKKKNKKRATDSTKLHATDTTAVPAKASSSNGRYSADPGVASTCPDRPFTEAFCLFRRHTVNSLNIKCSFKRV